MVNFFLDSIFFCIFAKIFTHKYNKNETYYFFNKCIIYLIF